ncbi:MAG: hypothetical protein EZS26_001088 [Candidatus Ordinivivax streblomastigis]|uniref:Secretion system C-terminal sorting domain-containing protein n=1 Tax=Candidatus Ordinivivax streblomastigis TaxID=2540710 RepID=A0A5M8P2D6_9BACT|nr:MAG: hypothetical protein EZS26_001088 [Candidatus Ordinivivax streblomastigis]
MKYYFILFLWLIFTAQIFAQYSLQSQLNMFCSGDVIVKQQVSYKDPGRLGENVLWDFSNLDAENEEYKLAYTSLNKDSIITGTEHRTMYYYSLSNDSLLLWGYENSTTLMTNQQPELLLKFPVNYGDKTNSYFSGSGKYCDRLQLTAMGTVQTHADAYGMMVLPSKDALKHVFRVKTVKWIAEETKPFSHKKGTANLAISKDSIDFRLSNDSTVLGVITYRWYERGYRYPIFETVKSVVKNKNSERKYFNTAFFFPPQAHYYLDEDEDNLSLLENQGNDQSNDSTSSDPWYGLTYNYYPNPVISDLNIEMYLPRPAKIRVQLTERGGRIMKEERWGMKPEGIFHQQISMGFFTVGEYVLNIWLDDGYMVSKKLFKR